MNQTSETAKPNKQIIPPTGKDWFACSCPTEAYLKTLTRQISIPAKCLQQVAADSQRLWQKHEHSHPFVKYLCFRSGIKRIMKKHHTGKLLELFNLYFPGLMLTCFQPQQAPVAPGRKARFFWPSEIKRSSWLSNGFRRIGRTMFVGIALAQDLFTRRGNVRLASLYLTWEQRLADLVQYQLLREETARNVPPRESIDYAFSNWKKR